MKKILFFVSAVTLLASCSKEITEEVAVPVTGKSTIYATYDGGQSSTRTTAEPNGNSYRLLWEIGDAVGVFDAVAEDQTNAYFAYAGSNVAFNGDMGFLYAEDYIGYYPYEKDRAIDKDGNITLTIPSTQNYRFNAIDEAAGSFAQNVAPAVAYGAASAGNELSLTFYPMATYLRIPIKGIGTVRTLELSISDVKLAGDFTVKLDDVKAATKSADIKINYEGGKFNEETITLVCGKGDKGVALNPSKETYFWFVVPAGTKLKDQEMMITVNGKDELTRIFDYEKDSALPVNTPIKMGQDAKGTAFEWVEDGAFLIKNEYEFLMYAYAATNGVEGAYEPMLNNEKNALLDAVIVNDLDFSPAAGFNPDPTISVAAQYGEYVKTVLFAYTANNNAIAMIGNATNKFVISGNVAGEAAKIENLTVKGTAMFNDGETQKLSNKVCNLTFANSTVDATGLKADAFFLTNRDYMGTNGILLEDITIEKSCQVLVDSDQETAVIGRAFTNKLSDIVSEVEDLSYANVLYVMNDVEDFVENEIPTYNTITVHNMYNGAILNVADQAAAKELVEKIDLKNPANHGTWFSVVSGYKPATTTAPASVETSYWTGTIATDEKADDIFTAEELAKVVKDAANLTTGGDKLTNDLDLMGGVTLDENLAKASHTGLNWGDVLSKSSMTPIKLDGTKGENGKYTISNAWVVPAEEATVPAVSLFGVRVGLTNIKVENAFVSDQNVGIVSNGISGLGIFAQNFEGVEVSNMLISAHANTTVGGLVRTVRNGAQIKDVYFSGRIAQQSKTLTRGTIAGEFAAPADNTDNTFTFTGVNGKSVGTPANLPVFGMVQVNAPASKAGSNYDVVINFYNFDQNGILPTNFVAGEAEADYTVRVNRSETTDGGTFKDHVVVVPVEE